MESARFLLRRWIAGALVAFVALALGAAPARAAAPLPIRVVVVTTFEVGRDTGDAPGEFQTWVERLPLAQTIPFPQGYHDLRYDAARGILGIVTGEGAERGAASIMALGSDPRFDLSHAYWVVAGIAGVDPLAASVGSAAWATWVINGDLAFEIDARDTPAGFSTGIIPFQRTAPYALPVPATESIRGEEAYPLNAGLAAWAYRLTAKTPLPDDANMRALRKPYTHFPRAQRPPFVLLGDSLCGDRFFIGEHMNAWARRWVAYWTQGRGHYVMTAEEDAGIMQSLTFLDHAHRVDARRVLVLRTASNFTAPASRATTAYALLQHDANPRGESAAREAFESAYRIGSRVVDQLANGWDRYRTTVPTASK
jgi:purine nucleoside permease